MKNLALTLFLLSASASLAQTTAPTTAQPAPPAASPASAVPANTVPANNAPANAAPATSTPANVAPATPAPATVPAPTSTITPAAPAAPAIPTKPTTPTKTLAPAPAVAPVVSPAVAPVPIAAAASAVVAQIGNEKLTLADFDSAFRVAVARVVNEQGAPFEEALLAEFNDARPVYLKQFVRDRAVYQLARANAKPDAAAIDAQIAKVKAEFKTDAQLQKALGQIGYQNLEGFRADLERQNVAAAYLSSLEKKFSFSNTMVSSFYSLHKSLFLTPAQACVKHILLANKPDADAVAKNLAAGGDFAKLAAAKSKDPGSAAQGGDLGCLKPGETVPPFDKASFGGPLNKVQVVQSEFGWHVLVVTKRTDAGLLPLTEVAPLIRTQMSRDAAQKYLESQIARLNVKSFPEVVTVAPATPKK